MKNPDECLVLDVDDRACYISFADGRPRPHRSKDVGRTVRDEMVILDCDRDGKIIGIELVGGSKPCQKP